jgi:hypothetical protein
VCEGDEWHRGDHYQADMEHWRHLERFGGDFFRVRGSTFYPDKDVRYSSGADSAGTGWDFERLCVPGGGKETGKGRRVEALS